MLTTADYVKGITSGDVSILAQAITLIESSSELHNQKAQELLVKILPKTGKAYRIAITGVPGVGKSTTIDTLGTNLCQMGHKVAVLTIDPSSQISGGAILGDKTRMENLVTNPNAFIRPSPTSGTLGGIAEKTRETMLLCEAAGFDVIIIETVGVGQSETRVADIVDFFLVMMLPGAGDELQGIKRGILELADMIVVNKADAQNVVKSKQAVAEYRAAMQIMSPKLSGWQTPVIAISGRDNIGLNELWCKVQEHKAIVFKDGNFNEKRRKQSVHWFHSMLKDKVINNFMNNDEVSSLMPRLEEEIFKGKLTPVSAVQLLLSSYSNSCD